MYIEWSAVSVTLWSGSISAADRTETSWHTLSPPSDLRLLVFFSSSPTSLICCWGGGGVLCQKPVLHHSSFDLRKSVRAHHSSELPENLTAYNKSWAGQNPSCSCVSLQAKTEGTVNQERRKTTDRCSRPTRHAHGLVTSWGGGACRKRPSCSMLKNKRNPRWTCTRFYFPFSPEVTFTKTLLTNCAANPANAANAANAARICSEFKVTPSTKTSSSVQRTAQSSKLFSIFG